MYFGQINIHGQKDMYNLIKILNNNMFLLTSLGSRETARSRIANLTTNYKAPRIKFPKISLIYFNTIASFIERKCSSPVIIFAFSFLAVNKIKASIKHII